MSRYRPVREVSGTACWTVGAVSPPVDLTGFAQHLLAQGLAPGTRRLVLAAVRLCCELTGCDPRGITSAHVVAFVGRDLTPQTRRSYLWALRVYADWAGLGPITEPVRRPRVPKGVPKPAAEEDIAALLAVASPRVRAYIMLGAYAGLRSFETAKVAGADFCGTPEGPALRVLGKGGRVDLVPLPGILLRELAPWREASGAGRLWPRTSAPRVQEAIRRASERADVRVSSHQLRHRYGTQLYAASRDLLVVQRLMRHASPVTTAGYAQVADAVGAELVNRLP